MSYLLVTTSVDTSADTSIDTSIDECARARLPIIIIVNIVAIRQRVA